MTAQTVRPVEQEAPTSERKRKWWEYVTKAKESFACRYEGGESMLQLAQRVYNLLDEIKAESGRKTYLLVAHNGIARVVRSYFFEMTNEEYAAFGVANCEVLKFEF